MRAVLVLLLLLANNQVLAGEKQAIMPRDIAACKIDSDCVIVPHNHCCGSTKMAINKKFLTAYGKNKAWQKFDTASTCAVIGQCMSDADVTDTKCEAGFCQLRFPK